MEWQSLLCGRIRARRQILFSKEDGPIRDLTELIRTMPRKAVILWALDMAEETVRELEQKYPGSPSARRALEMSRLWAQGIVRMPEAKRAILACHAEARRTDNKADISRFHAVGLACATVHTTGHAIGFPLYALTALVRENGPDSCSSLIDAEIGKYRERLLYWKLHCRDGAYGWAGFLRETDEGE